MMTQTPENNLYLWWRDRSPQERAEYRKDLSSVEVTNLFKQIQSDCRLYLNELEASPQGNGHATAPPREKNKLHEEWEKLSPDQQEELEALFFGPQQLEETG